ncbi:MAG: DUF1674 domain-containing protein [Pseudomonadota bacterium]
MSKDGSQTPPPGAAPGKDLPPEAVRALKEAAERRAAEDVKREKAREIGGPKGEEPTRFGDWERGGRAVDF